MKLTGVTLSLITAICAVVAIAGSAAATTIHVSKFGEYGHNTIQSGLDATGEADCVTIDASLNGRGILAHDGNDIKVEGFRIQNGYVGDCGGAMLINSTAATIKNCWFANNNSAFNAMTGTGAVSLIGGSFTLIDCVFTGDVAEFAFGAA